jgi:GTPase
MSDMQFTSLEEIKKGNFRALARAISYVENGLGNYFQLLMDMPAIPSAIVGITGPPGAGKSTLVDALIGQFVQNQQKIAVLCVDPSSAIHYGALLGDRIRMSDWYNHPNVFIRSLSSRGSLGGLHPRILEITDLLKVAGFDLIIIETVGVGQNEIEIAGLADTTLVVLVPEGGDEVQVMKAGLMEIADIFVVNKNDRPGADTFVRNLRMMITPASHQGRAAVEILTTNAVKKTGIPELAQKIEVHLQKGLEPALKYQLLAERAYYLIRNEKMRDINKRDMMEQIGKEYKEEQFNLYRFINRYL